MIAVSTLSLLVYCDRAVGTTISYEISRRWQSGGLPDDTITLNLKGHAGQSFGAWGQKGLTINLEGDSNDYVAKVGEVTPFARQLGLDQYKMCVLIGCLSIHLIELWVLCSC